MKSRYSSRDLAYISVVTNPPAFSLARYSQGSCGSIVYPKSSLSEEKGEEPKYTNVPHPAVLASPLGTTQSKASLSFDSQMFYVELGKF